MEVYNFVVLRIKYIVSHCAENDQRGDHASHKCQSSTETATKG